MEAKIIEHRDKNLLYLNYKGAKTDEEKVNLLRKGIQMGESYRDIGILVNIEGQGFSKEYMDEVKKCTQGDLGKMALVGANTVMRIFMNTIIAVTGRNNFKVFNREEGAMEWLAS